MAESWGPSHHLAEHVVCWSVIHNLFPAERIHHALQLTKQLSYVPCICLRSPEKQKSYIRKSLPAQQAGGLQAQGRAHAAPRRPPAGGIASCSGTPAFALSGLPLIGQSPLTCGGRSALLQVPDLHLNLTPKHPQKHPGQCLTISGH